MLNISGMMLDIASMCSLINLYCKYVQVYIYQDYSRASEGIYIIVEL